MATTHTEIVSGQTENFLRRFLETEGGLSTAPFRRIYVNRTCDIPDTLKAAASECGFEFTFLDIDPVEDIYVRCDSNYKPPIIPPMGLIAGPNISFFRVMRDMASVGNDTILLLETDCKFGKAWLERMSAYVTAAGNFWIAGAFYDGHLITDDELMKTHINGVALYKVGCPSFQEFLNEVEKYIIWKVKYDYPRVSYDMAIRDYINIKCQYATNKMNLAEWIRWRYVNRCLVPTQLIVNASCREDASIPEKDFEALYNYAILHQK